jgi:hypothetical protein
MGSESIQTMYFCPHSSFPSATYLTFWHNELIPHWGRPTASKRFIVQTVEVKTNSRCAVKVRNLNSNLGNKNLSILNVFLSPLIEMQLLYLKLCHNSCLKYSSQMNRSTEKKSMSTFPISHVSFPGLRLTTRGSNLDRVKVLLSSPKWPDQLWGPPSLVFDTYWGLPAHSAEVKNEWSCTFTPHICQHAPSTFTLFHLPNSTIVWGNSTVPPRPSSGPFPTHKCVSIQVAEVIEPTRHFPSLYICRPTDWRGSSYQCAGREREQQWQSKWLLLHHNT